MQFLNKILSLVGEWNVSLVSIDYGSTEMVVLRITVSSCLSIINGSFLALAGRLWLSTLLLGCVLPAPWLSIPLPGQ